MIFKKLIDDFGGLPDYYQTFYRNYDAAIGRFVATDPMAEATADMSVYQYANNNPIMMNDPMGNMAKAGSMISYQHDPYELYSMYQRDGVGNYWFASALYDTDFLGMYASYTTSLYHLNKDGATTGAWSGLLGNGSQFQME